MKIVQNPCQKALGIIRGTSRLGTRCRHVYTLAQPAIPTHHDAPPACLIGDGTVSSGSSAAPRGRREQEGTADKVEPWGMFVPIPSINENAVDVPMTFEFHPKA